MLVYTPYFSDGPICQGCLHNRHKYGQTWQRIYVLYISVTDEFGSSPICIRRNFGELFCKLDKLGKLVLFFQESSQICDCISYIHSNGYIILAGFLWREWANKHACKHNKVSLANIVHEFLTKC